MLTHHFIEKIKFIWYIFNAFNSNQEKFRSQGISKHFQLGFIRDIPLISSGKLAIGLGLGYSFKIIILI